MLEEDREARLETWCDAAYSPRTAINRGDANPVGLVRSLSYGWFSSGSSHGLHAARKQINRRSFLRGAASVGVAASTGFTQSLLAQPTTAKWAKQIGIELYTVRDEMEKDFEGTLAKVAQLGYKEVEPANGYNNMTPTAFRKMLDRYGLNAPSTHSGPVIGPNLEKELEGFQIMGINYTSVPTPPRQIVPGRAPGSGMMGAYFGGHNSFTQAEAFGPIQNPITLAEAQRRAAELNKFGKIGKKFDVKMLVHNHTGEFEKLTDSEGTEYDVYLAECDPDLVAMQLDLGWATIAGQDIVGHVQEAPSSIRTSAYQRYGRHPEARHHRQPSAPD